MEGEGQVGTEQRFTVRIESDMDDDKLSFEKRVDGPTVAKIMNLLYMADFAHDGAWQAHVLRDTANSYAADVENLPPMSFPEFLERLQADNNFRRIAAVALYLRDHHGQGHVSRDELPDWFKKAGYPIPKNISRDIRVALRRGLIAEERSKEGFYYVTRKGEEQLRAAGDE